MLCISDRIFGEVINKSNGGVASNALALCDDKFASCVYIMTMWISRGLVLLLLRSGIGRDVRYTTGPRDLVLFDVVSFDFKHFREQGMVESIYSDASGKSGFRGLTIDN